MDKNSVWDFMNALIDGPEPDIDQEYFEMEEQYKRLFGHGVPREMFPDSITDENIKAAMKTCIENGEDSLYSLLGVQIDNRPLY